MVYEQQVCGLYDKNLVPVSSQPSTIHPLSIRHRDVILLSQWHFTVQRYIFISLIQNVFIKKVDHSEPSPIFTWGSQHCLSGLTTSQFASVDTAKAHASVRMREQAAVLSCKCPVEWLIRETIEKAGCSIRVLNYSFFVKHPNILRKNLWTHAVVLYCNIIYFSVWLLPAKLVYFLYMSKVLPDFGRTISLFAPARYIQRGILLYHVVKGAGIH